MRTIVVSDAHIKSNNSKDYRIFCNFIESLFDKKIDLLIMLGDIFDFLFIEPREIYYRNLYEHLKKLNSNGTRIIYLYGNHDFNFKFKKYNFIETASELIEFKIDEYKSYIYHGDGLDPKDYKYRILKKIVRSKPFYCFYKLFPKSFVYYLADLFSNWSRSLSKANNPENKKNLQKENALKFIELNTNINLVIFAHTHLVDLKELDNPKKVYLNTGSFMIDKTYISIFDGFLKLNKFE